MGQLSTNKIRDIYESLVVVVVLDIVEIQKLFDRTVLLTIVVSAHDCTRVSS